MTTVEKMARELSSCGMEKWEATQRADTIVTRLKFDSLDYLQVSLLLRPDAGFVNGIAEKDMRELAAFKVLAVYICESFGTDIAQWAGLQMWCGMTPKQASDYQKRYEERKKAA